ncbi:MAG: LuxR C-terminal-related transcriptional regulator [Candidatus Obscuribacterales bacterium]|nr:LuxR C-terminal-related transcriptional regulator [Candidatus Obscuribacterales bacterium]
MTSFASINGPTDSVMEEIVLTQLRLPLLILDRSSGAAIRANSAFRTAFEVADLSFSTPISELIPFSKEIESLLARVRQDSGQRSQSVIVGFEGNTYEAIASPLDDESGQNVCIIFSPRSRGSQELARVLGGGEAPPNLQEASSQAIDHLGRQLQFERTVRQIVTKLYSSLDKDTVAQGLVDNIGRALKCQRCLVIIESSSALPVVTYEYAEADISPLGLGRTAKFPASVFERVLQGLVAVPDVTNLRTVQGVMLEDVNDLLDNSVSSMAGAPMVHRGAAHGVIVALNLGSIRKWDVQDLDLLQICAHHAAISLEHCQSLQRIKDQLFNVNVWGNLTQQLTSTLELFTHSQSRPAERQTRSSEPTGEMPALSSRELEVLKLIASGLANKEIANQLFLTESTVELHASRIRKKLKLRSRTALVKYACDHDIV